MPLKEKIKDIWGDFTYYIYYQPRGVYRSIRHWFITCAKYKAHWKFANNATFHNYPWDFSYFYGIQRDWIKKSYAYFKNGGYCSDEKSNDILRYQKICLGLLDIILDERDFWDYDMKNHKIILHIPVNLKNKKRFPIMCIDAKGRSFMSTEYFDKNPEEYYRHKAQCLYYKILNERSGEWWD